MTPAKVVEQGTRRTAALKLPPKDAALCIERNAENRSGYYLARQRPLPDQGIEIVIRFTELLGVLAVAHLHAEGAGSAVEIWVSPNSLVDADGLRKSFIAGC
jgi:hypothetical protein